MTNDAVVRACEHCHAPVPPDHDFCPNGHYVAWETFEQVAQREDEPAPEPAVPAVAPPERPDVSVVLDVSLADAPPRALAGAVAVVTAAGTAVKLVATLRNEGAVVDDYTVRVRGLPAGWVTDAGGTAQLLAVDQQPASAPVELGEAHLLPIDQQRDFERRLAFRVQPPLTPQATAGTWRFTVAVTSLAAGNVEVAAQDCTIDVLPFVSVVVAARPAIASGRRSATFVCEVRNNGNRGIVPVLTAIDADAVCTFVMPASIETIPPATTRPYPIAVRAPSRLLIGRALDRPVTIGVVVDGLETPPPPQLVTFRQRPILPWWLIPLVAFLIAAAAFVYTQWPHRVTTPLLKGAKSAFVAQGELQRAGFRKPPVVHTRVLARPAAGTVYDQRPKAGTKVDHDTIVTIRVAVPPTTTIIPDLTGVTALRADSILFRDHLALGNVVPSPKSKNPIVSQIPRAGSVKPRNTVVNVVLADSPAVKIPNVTCKTAGSAEKILNAAGFKLMVVPTTVSPSAHARGQIPVPGAKRKPGAEVTLQFTGPPPTCPGGKKLGARAGASKKTAANGKTGNVGTIGSPAGRTVAADAPVGFIAYSVDGMVHVTGGSRSPATGTQPAWSPGGSLLATRANGQIRVTRPLESSQPVATVAVPGSELSVPAFAPVRDTPALAFVATSASGGASRLCFASLAASAPTSSCRVIGEVEPRSLVWAPGGRGLLLVAADVADPLPPGLQHFAAATAGEVDAASWRADGGGLVRPARHGTVGAVLDAAYLPGGNRLALVTNLRPNGTLAAPQVVLADPERLADLAGARWMKVRGCSLDVSPDGALLAVGSPRDGDVCDGRGALVTVPITNPRARVTLAPRAGRPAWGADPQERQP
jgi:beta-lactam-binding protein with PASTA domain